MLIPLMGLLIVAFMLGGIAWLIDDKQRDQQVAQLKNDCLVLRARAHAQAKRADEWMVKAVAWGEEATSCRASLVWSEGERKRLLAAADAYDEWSDYVMRTVAAGERPLSITGWWTERNMERQFGPVGQPK